jgi:RNA polymerase sigma factor (sigma-70 family)
MREDDFEALYAEHAQSLLAFLSYRTGDRRLAEDLTADTFERVLRARGKFDRRKSSMKTWLYTIALNLLRDHLRHDAVHRRVLERMAAPSETHEVSPFEVVGTRDSVQRALATLSDEERETVALRVGAELSFPEIARLLRSPVSTVEGRCDRALRKLKAHLDTEQGDATAEPGSRRH